MKKKLIEVALPLDAINKASARASIRNEAEAMLDWSRMRRLCEAEVRDDRR